MIEILLICSSGLSTSYLVKEMQIAAEKLNINVNINAIGIAASQNHVDKVDVILLTPQVRHKFLEISALVSKNTPVGLIDITSYAAIDGDLILNYALGLIK